MLSYYFILPAADDILLLEVILSLLIMAGVCIIPVITPVMVEILLSPQERSH